MTTEKELLQRRLEQAIVNRKKIEESCNTQIDLLTQFISRLSVVCKGQNVELDNRLAKFRSELKKGVDFELVMPLISETLSLLTEHGKKNEANFRKLHMSVESAGKKLQKKQGLPPELRRNLRSLLTSDLDKIKATNDFIPVLSNLVEIYHQVLEKSTQANGTVAENSAPELAQELLNLTSELAFEGDSAKRLDFIKRQVCENQTMSVLLDSCVEIIRIIVATISQERDSAQNFLLAINETLSILHQSLLKSVERSNDIGSQMSDLNTRIQAKIASIETEVDSASSVAQLKQVISHKIEALTLDIQAKEQLEIEERDNLISSFNTMQHRVTQLERETAMYRERLAEQRFKSLQDSLTELPNRAAFDERMAIEFNAFQRNNNSLCLVVLDIDFFKKINDNYGHSAGDKTLQVIAKALKKSIRKTDFLARFGGEEFIMLMPHSDLEQVIVPLEKLRKTIKAIPFKFKNKNVTITISIGATQLKANDTFQEAFDRADSALYEAKNNGRDRLVIKK